MIRAGWTAVGAVVLVAATATGVTVAMARSAPPSPAAQESAATTAPVEVGTLSSMVSVRGTLTYRARADGSPYTVINQARGTYTALPSVGDEVGCGEELYRVDDQPVLLLCGQVPAYRDLRVGDVGSDVRQLNATLHHLGDDAAAGVDLDPDDGAFTDGTARALQKRQQATGAEATGALAIDDAVFLPESVRIALVVGPFGGAAQPGAPVLQGTSATLEVQVDLEGSQQTTVTAGARARIILPSNTSIPGTVARLGSVARAPAEPDGSAGPATISASISLDDTAQAQGLEQAPVRVEITTDGVDRALSVPVTAVVGRSGGGFAVEVVRDGGRRELVAVELGLFDATAGRVQVEGDLLEGDQVAVPAS